MLKDDIFNMYNETDKVAVFDALRLRRPQLIPVYAFFYAEPAPIRLSRSNGQLRIEVSEREYHEGKGILDGDDLCEDDDATSEPTFYTVTDAITSVVTFMRRVFSHVGLHQGCCLATFGAILPYHEVLRVVCEHFRDLICLCDADDTVYSGHRSFLYEAFAFKAKLQKDVCGLISTVSKLLAYAPSGNYSGVPDGIPTAEHGLEIVGTFHGLNGEWCAEQLDHKLNGTPVGDGSRKGGKLATVDALDALVETERVKHVKQLQQRALRQCVAAKPTYWARGTRPSRTRTAMANVDNRVNVSLALIAEAKDSPADRCERFLKQEHLPLCMGGGGYDNNAGTCAAKWVASVAGTLHKVMEFVPSLAGIDVLKSELPFFVEFRTEYAKLRAMRDSVAVVYDALDRAQYYSFDGSVKSKFHHKGLPPTKALPELTSTSFTGAPSTTTKPPASRTLCSIVHHEGWCELFSACHAVDLDNNLDPNFTFVDRECSRLISAGGDHGGAWLDVLPTSTRLPSAEMTVALQRRFGLYISAATAVLDAQEAEGWAVGEFDRLGDGFAHAANHSTAHKWICAAWRDAESASSGATVYLGDKKLGLLHYSEYNATYIPDIIKIGSGDDGRPELDEVKNYSCFVTKSTNHAAVTTLNGGAYAFGNTEEALKHRVLGTRARGHAAAGKFNHADGSGRVAPHAGDYRDAINNRKATVHLLVHEATMGSMSPYAARRLRRLARDASDNGTDGTDYTRSYTARSFVPHFAQRISTACVMEGAKGILKGIRKKSHDHLRRALATA